MKKLFFMLFIIFGLCASADKLSGYTEVSEPEYVLIYETKGLYTINNDNGVLTQIENGKYKFTDEMSVTYLTIKDSAFNGKFYVYDRKTNSIKYEYSYKNGIEDGKWTEYDKNEKPALIDHIKNGLIIKREIFVNGKLTVTKTFQEGIPVMP